MKFYLTRNIGNNPFLECHNAHVKILKEYNCFVVNDVRDADVIVSHTLKKLLPFILRYPRKKFLVWTNEPRYDTNFVNEVNLPFWLPKVQIMNVYGKDVFWHNLHFLSSYHFDTSNNLGIKINTRLKHFTSEELKISGKKDKIAALFTNTMPTKSALIKEAKNIDLSNMRCRYALSGRERYILDIYGNKWPEGYTIDNSGYGFEKQRPWWIEKIDILKTYKYNLCFENTACGYYVTEKIWHAIFSYCLPIYTSFNSNIYETFPQDSFIDAFLFKDENELFDYIESMSEDEYLRRLNICIDVFNDSIKIRESDYHLVGVDNIKKILERLS